jgi:hypothetical protein
VPLLRNPLAALARLRRMAVTQNEVALGDTLPAPCIARRRGRCHGASSQPKTILSAGPMPTDATKETETAGWASAWPDALAFVVWLAVAWYAKWTATDLVWSLWLSSFVVGYTLIVWSIFRPEVDILRGLWKMRNDESPPLRMSMSVRSVGRAGSQSTADSATQMSTPMSVIAMGAVMLIGGLLLLAFFTIHFGGFHYVHSQFLIEFFPLQSGDGLRHGLADKSTYLEVFRRYWKFLPMAFIAERGAFMKKSLVVKPDDLSVTAAAIAARKLANAKKPASGFAEPYRNVMRMHFLIFFFAFAHFAKVENFGVYAVVYTVYFFPWRLVRRQATPLAAPATVSSGG